MPTETNNCSGFFLDNNSNLKSDVEILNLNNYENNSILDLKENYLISDNFIEKLIKLDSLEEYDKYLEVLNFIYYEYLLFKNRITSLCDEILTIKKLLKIELEDYNDELKLLKEELLNLDLNYPIENSSDYFTSLKNENNNLLKEKKKKNLIPKFKNIKLKIVANQFLIDYFDKYIIYDQDLNIEIEKKILIILDKIYIKYQDSYMLYDCNNINNSIKIINYSKKINIYSDNLLNNLKKNIYSRYCHLSYEIVRVDQLIVFLNLIFSFYNIVSLLKFILFMSFIIKFYLKNRFYSQMYLSEYLFNYRTFLNKIYVSPINSIKIKFIFLNLFSIFLFYIYNWNLLFMFNYIIFLPKIFIINTNIKII